MLKFGTLKKSRIERDNDIAAIMDQVQQKQIELRAAFNDAVDTKDCVERFFDYHRLETQVAEASAEFDKRIRDSFDKEDRAIRKVQRLSTVPFIFSAPIGIGTLGASLLESMNPANTIFTAPIYGYAAAAMSMCLSTMLSLENSTTAEAAAQKNIGIHIESIKKAFSPLSAELKKERSLLPAENIEAFAVSSRFSEVLDVAPELKEKLERLALQQRFAALPQKPKPGNGKLEL